ncbi:hypothetical protein [Pseudonocardia sp. ICBG601]|uniref:hypothetical protein n=1 Tax=Pseudonocardia sp. ICBG601 TaxID=2846759 RepID=UPI001CF61A19|nr:hypothetical protein [Pseudonocardia sp. ICBG601]
MVTTEEWPDFGIDLAIGNLDDAARPGLLNIVTLLGFLSTRLMGRCEDRLDVIAEEIEAILAESGAVGRRPPTALEIREAVSRRNSGHAVFPQGPVDRVDDGWDLTKTRPLLRQWGREFRVLQRRERRLAKRQERTARAGRSGLVL